MIVYLFVNWNDPRREEDVLYERQERLFQMQNPWIRGYRVWSISYEAGLDRSRNCPYMLTGRKIKYIRTEINKLKSCR